MEGKYLYAITLMDLLYHAICSFYQKVMGLIGLSYLDLRLLIERNVKKSGVKIPHKESHVSSVVKMVAYKL